MKTSCHRVNWISVNRLSSVPHRFVWSFLVPLQFHSLSYHLFTGSFSLVNLVWRASVDRQWNILFFFLYYILLNDHARLAFRSKWLSVLVARSNTIFSCFSNTINRLCTSRMPEPHKESWFRETKWKEKRSCEYTKMHELWSKWIVSLMMLMRLITVINDNEITVSVAIN